MTVCMCAGLPVLGGVPSRCAEYSDHRRGGQLLPSVMAFDACARVIGPWIASPCKLSYLCMIALRGRAYQNVNDCIFGHVPYED